MEEDKRPGDAWAKKIARFLYTIDDAATKMPPSLSACVCITLVDDKLLCTARHCLPPMIYIGMPLMIKQINDEDQRVSIFNLKTKNLRKQFTLAFQLSEYSGLIRSIRKSLEFSMSFLYFIRNFFLKEYQKQRDRNVQKNVHY